MSQYPKLGQILRLALPALLLAQFLIWPLVGLHSPRAGLIAAELVIIWLMVFFIRRRHLVFEDILLLNATPVATLIIVAATAVGASLTIAEFDLLWARLLAELDLELPLSIQRSLLEIQVVDSLPELLLGLLAVALAPALCEELFFRGFAFTGLYVHYGPRMAVAGTALLFALAHFNPWQLPTLLLFGLFLGLLVYCTHSIYPAILAHLINNLISFAGVNLRAHWGLEELAPFRHLPLPVTSIALLILIGGLFLLRRQPTIIPLPPRQLPSVERIPPLPEAPSPHPS